MDIENVDEHPDETILSENDSKLPVKKKHRHSSQPTQSSGSNGKSKLHPAKRSNSKKLSTPKETEFKPKKSITSVYEKKNNGTVKKSKLKAEVDENLDEAVKTEEVAVEKPLLQRSASMSKLTTEIETTEPDLNTFNRVFTGIFHDLPSPLSKLVRVFTSSTFTDTTVERNALMEDVYPALKRYCRETHGLDFQATDDHMTTNLCINEIHNCQRLSMGPNFVVFLGQKYGYRPIPSQILSKEFEMLKQALSEQHDDISVLDLWYTEDTNAVPAQVILQPISSILVNFNNKRIPKLQEQDAKSWWEVEARMQNLLRKGAKICHDRQQFNNDQLHNYYMSGKMKAFGITNEIRLVTEREVINGILQANNPNEHCLCYVRQIKNININQTSTASKFIDIVHKQVNQEAQKLLTILRDERVPEVLRSQNIRRSAVEWAGREGMDPRIHSDYIKEFCSDFYSSITNMVDAAMRKHAKYRDVFFAEVLQHMWNALQGSSMFYGRDKELATAQEYLRSTNDTPMVFYGEHGCGKTSILAKIAIECRRWLTEGTQAEPVLILRFLGTSPDSSSIGPLLTSVCEQIACNYSLALRKQCPTELSKLFQHFKRMTYLASEERPLVIVLDSLDLLSKMDGSDELLWFPPTLPPHVKLIASLSSGTKVETTMRRLVENEDQYVLVPALGSQLGQQVIEKWLEAKGRTLSPRQWEIVGKALTQCSLPLFLKLVYATVFRWKAYSKPQEVVLFKSVQQSIHALFDRTESQHGKLLVSHALSYITAAKSGISDSELEDLISLDDKVLDDIYQYHLPPVRRIPPLLWSRIRADLPGYLSERAADGVIVLNWYHEQFRTAANEPDLQKQRFGVVENEGLADRKVPKQANFFRTKDSNQIRYNSRKLNELPYHLLRARRWKELFSLCLFNFEFLQSKLCCFPLQVIISDFEDAISKCDDPDSCRQLTLVMDGLRLSASLLSRYPWMFAFELAGRLLPLVAENEEIKNLLKGCDLQGHEFNCFKPAHHCFHSPGGPLKHSLEEHPFAVFGMELSGDQKMLVSTSNQLIVWDVFSGDLTRIINPNIEGIFLGMALSNDDKYAAAYTNNNQIAIMSLIAGDFKLVDPDGMEEQMQVGKVLFTEDQNILLWSSTQFYVYDVSGTLLHRERIDPTVAKKNLLEVFFKNKRSVKFLTWTGNKNDWDVMISGREENKQLETFSFAAALAFYDNRFMSGVVCVPQSAVQSGAATDDCNFCIATFEIHGGQVRLKKVIANDMEERTNALFYWRRPPKADGTANNWMIAVQVQGFLLCPNMLVEQCVTLHLPDDVRNIPVRPMHTTSSIASCCNDALFVAGVRKNLYIFNVGTSQLVRTIDAHFGRILNLRSVTTSGHNILISSSIDRSIKIWNVDNIYEKSFSVINMDQPIEKILIPRHKPHLAITQTRKYLSLWDIRSHKFVATLVTNQFGSVIVDCVVTADGRLVVCVESEQLLVWELRTQSVRQRMPAPSVHELVLLADDKMIGVVYRQLDTQEQKMARLVVYRMSDLAVFFSYEYTCRIFRNLVVLKDTTTVVAVALTKGKEQIQTISVTERAIKQKFRPRALKKHGKDMEIHALIPVPTSSNNLIVMDNESRGAMWDLKAKKIIRHLPTFSGMCTTNGKLGLHAPSAKGGLHIVDMKSGATVKTLIPLKCPTNCCVNDVQARFTATDDHVLYYHSGQQTLRAFRVVDGQLIGTFRPHSRIITWTSDPTGEKIVIGGADGSLITAFLYDEQTHPNAQKNLAVLPSRRYLADHLGIVVDDGAETTENVDVRNLTIVSKAVQKFKGLTVKHENSAIPRKKSL
ncbi:hypothetical protein M3Y96_00651200 [Aphelenchoides besseyi]|nr:hypothetical protein M3Y96_00651200 [Aphelenchoides besseyi]